MIFQLMAPDYVNMLENKSETCRSVESLGFIIKTEKFINPI